MIGECRAPRHSRIGILGGSFDPAHDGHLHLSREAVKRFGLDRVWWLVSPGNPLKADPPAPLAARMAAARRLAQDPRICVSDLEARIATRYTADTVSHLVRRWPQTRFVWLMGADNLVQFHRWDAWRSILARIPVGVLARPGHRLAARRSVAARVFPGARLGEAQSRLLPLCEPPVWCYVTIPLHPASSSSIRAMGRWSDRGADTTA